MPFAYPHPQHLKQDILARVAAGELLSTVCAQPGMPSLGAVRLWSKADPAFAEALAAARRRCDWRRRCQFDDAKAKALLARLLAGEGIVSVLSDPAMPSRRTYAYWRATQGEFAAEIHRINGLRLDDKRARMRARSRPYDPEIADRILARVLRGVPLSQVRADPTLASGTLITRWRRENPEFNRLLNGALAIAARNRRRLVRPSPRCTDDLVSTIMERMIYGASLASLGLQPDMPCRATLYAWKRNNPDFARALAIARMGRDDLRDDKRLIRAEGAAARAHARAEARSPK